MDFSKLEPATTLKRELDSITQALEEFDNADKIGRLTVDFLGVRAQRYRIDVHKHPEVAESIKRAILKEQEEILKRIEDL